MEGLATAAGHEDRHAPLKDYCKGLLLPGERKSIEPMAARLDPHNVQATRQSLHLSFAITTSGGIGLGCEPLVTVMETTDLRDFDDPSCPRYLPRKRTLLSESEVSSGGVIIAKVQS